jgi:zinc protease
MLALLLIVLLAAAPASAVEIRRVQAEGLEAWLVEDHSNPIIAVRFAFRGGAALDPPERAGVAEMAMALLDEGAGDLDAQAFKRRLEDNAIRLSFDADRDALGGSLTTLTPHRAEAFELLRLALTRPRFDADAIARVRSQLEAGLRRDAEDPETVAARTLFAKLFPGTPYGQPVEGTLDSIARIDRGDLERFARGRLARSNLLLGIVGDIDAATLAPLLTATFGALPATAEPASLPAMPPQTAGGLSVVSMAVPQSAVTFAQRGPLRAAPEYYTATVLNQVLGGGGLTSLLFEEVREKRGLVYGVYSALLPLQHAGLWLGGAASANERVSETVAVIREVWAKVAATGITPAQLADAKTYLTGSFPLRFTSSGRIAGILVATQLDNLGIDYLNRRNGLIEAVSLSDVNALARTMLAADALTFVVVGEPEGLAPAESPKRK